jgi:hypothetical protein
MVYEQLTGKLLNAGDAVIGIGYSGSPAGKNDPSKEGVESVGPIPCGNYTVKGPPFDSPKHGPYVLHLVPDDDTRAFITSLGRDPDTFLMHGDKVGAPGTASEGCVIMSRGVRESVWGDNAVDPYLTVVSGLPTGELDETA